MTAIKVDERMETTRSELKRMRREGIIPAVVYGKEQAAATIAVEAKALMHLLRDSNGGVMEMEMPNKQRKTVMIREIQRDPMNGEILHMDFRQVNLEETVRTTVRLHYSGQPVGVKEGGLQQIIEHEVEISCKPRDIPAAIPVDISSLQIGQTVTAADLSVPSGIEILTPPHEILLTILEQQKVEEESVGEPKAAAEAERGAEQEMQPS